MNNSRTPDGRSYLKVPASSGGYTKRSMPALPPAMSTLQQLEAVVVSEPTWRVIEHVKNAAPTQGVRCRYTPIDIVVMGVAAQQYGSVIEADRNLRDPDVWERLRRAAWRHSQMIRLGACHSMRRAATNSRGGVTCTPAARCSRCSSGR